MNFLIITISCFLFLLIVSIVFKISYFMRLNIFILVILLNFALIFLSYIRSSFPYEIIILYVLLTFSIIFQIFSSYNLLEARVIIKDWLREVSHIMLLFLSTIYIALISFHILSLIGFWLSSIIITALTSYLLYLYWSLIFEHIHYHQPFSLIIVLGAGIYTEQVTPMLAQRLDKGLRIYKSSSKNCKILVSGGQGKDEPISEALAMQRYLINKGVNETQIIMEDSSTNTFENFKYTKNIINGLNLDISKVSFVTSQFHVLRSLKFSHEFKIKALGIGSTTPYQLLIFASFRDFLALMYQYKFLLALHFGILFILFFFFK